MRFTVYSKGKKFKFKAKNLYENAGDLTFETSRDRIVCRFNSGCWDSFHVDKRAGKKRGKHGK